MAHSGPESAAELAARIRSGQLTPTEAVQAALRRIEERNPALNAFVSLRAEEALAEARAMTREIAEGREPGPLAGVPVGVKDLEDVAGMVTSFGSTRYRNNVALRDSVQVARLRAAGAIVLGKTNTPEFGYTVFTKNRLYGVTRNPWDVARTPGGSSGGSAAAVAAGMCLGALGSDTGGSIRQPASHCGVVGLKPTYGRVSRYGLVAYASSLDQIGPLTRSVADAALLTQGIAGYDGADSTSVSLAVPDYTAALGMSIEGIRVGIPAEYSSSEGLDPEVSAAVEDAVRTLESLGAKRVSISLPHTRYAVAVYYVIAPCEASSNLARYAGVKYGFRADAPADLMHMYRRTRSQGFGAEVQRRIIIGTYCLSAGYYDAYYGKASQVRTLIVEDFKKAFQACDVIACPTAPTPAFKIGEKIDDPLTMYLSDIFTISANLAGVPAMSIPCGFSASGLPIGLQLMAKHFDEEMLFRVAHHFEQATEYHKRKPVF